MKILLLLLLLLGQLWTFDGFVMNLFEPPEYVYSSALRYERMEKNQQQIEQLKDVVRNYKVYRIF